jgi:alkylated DNA repair dioxygenase AlkB
LLQIRKQLEHEVAERLALPGVSFNAVLLNAYRTGEDGMGWHQDNEPELGTEPVIASLSLGASRRFSIRAKAGKARWNLTLEPGSLLLMHGRSQVDFQHSVPKTRLAVAQRINLTFRQIKPKGPLKS